MSQAYEYQERRGGGCGSVFLNFLLMLAGAVLVLMLVLAVGLFSAGDRFVSGLGDIFNPPPPTPQVDVRSVIIEQVRGASELTTTVFTMQTVSDASQVREVLGFQVGTTRLLFIGWGEVRAGVDLSALEAADVEVISDTIRIRLPAPRILDAKIDVTRSSVYDYDQGFLGLGPAAPELQTLAERAALDQVMLAACQEGVLERANEEAEIAITQLLSIAGYKSVIVETRPPDSSTCAQPQAPGG